MASLSDGIDLLTEIGFIEVVAVFLLVYAIIYLLLKNTNIFVKDDAPSQSLVSIIALAVSLIAISNPTGRKVILNLTNFLTIYVLVLFFLIFILVSVGYNKESIGSFILPSDTDKKKSGGFWAIFWGVGLLIIIGAIGTSFPDVQQTNLEKQALELNISLADRVQQLTAFERVIYFTSLPSVLGVIFILIIFGFGGFMIARGATKDN